MWLEQVLVLQQTYPDESSARANTSNNVYHTRIVASSQPRSGYWIWIRGPNLEACPPLSHWALIGRVPRIHSRCNILRTALYLFIYLPSSPKGPGECAGRANADGGEGIGRLLTRDVWDVRGVGRQEMEN